MLLEENRCLKQGNAVAYLFDISLDLDYQPMWIRQKNKTERGRLKGSAHIIKMLKNDKVFNQVVRKEKTEDQVTIVMMTKNVTAADPAKDDGENGTMASENKLGEN